MFNFTKISKFRISTLTQLPLLNYAILLNFDNQLNLPFSISGAISSMLTPACSMMRRARDATSSGARTFKQFIIVIVILKKSYFN